MSESKCPFCPPPAERVVEENDLAAAFNDAYPVAGGHCLIIPKRHVASWFETTAEERTALFELVDRVKQRLEDFASPDGYNIGINDGRSAGQTVFHLHIHLIPRRTGDVQNPRGGVRGVFPGKADYRQSEE